VATAGRGFPVPAAVCDSPHREHDDKDLHLFQILVEVTSGDVRTASVNPGGAISGSLKGGDQYTSQIPKAIDDTRLAPRLKAHHVNVTGVGTGSPLLADLLSLLSLLLFVAFFIWIGRRNAKQLSGGIMGFGGSKAKVYDEEKPTTASPTLPVTRVPSVRCPKLSTS
jgi:ATP-dependent Zn protease